jgi:hypothetical protein
MNQEIPEFLAKSKLSRPCAICHKMTEYYDSFRVAYVCSPKCLNLLEDLIAKAEAGEL